MAFRPFAGNLPCRSEGFHPFYTYLGTYLGKGIHPKVRDIPISRRPVAFQAKKKKSRGGLEK
jgi:hypothetical protein